MQRIIGKFTAAAVMIDEVEEACLRQIRGFVDHPAFTNPIAIMPDTHAGKGSVIGFTMPLSPLVIPAVIGVDINCGMLSLELGQLSYDKLAIDCLVREAVPFGMNVHPQAKYDMKMFPWQEVNELAQNFVRHFNRVFGRDVVAPTYDERWYKDLMRRLGYKGEEVVRAIGTLGSGNHFIEFGRSQQTDQAWVTIHTGSRNVGKRICDYWQQKACDNLRNVKKQELLQKIEKIKDGASDKSQVGRLIEEARRELGLDVKVPNNLEYLEGEEAAGYFFDMIFASIWARVNRRTIAHAIVCALGAGIHDMVETCHNFIDFQDFIIRKGAIRAYKGERMIIPFNMEYGILLCEGKSNQGWNFSAPHGAGRLMSRAEAKRTLSLAKYERQMAEAGVFSTSVCLETLDEAPDAYKDPEIIRQAIEPTAVILDRIVPFHGMKDKTKNNRKKN